MSFYKNFYESKDTTSTLLDHSFFFGENDTVLKGYEQNACEESLTERECLEPLNTMESEKNSRDRWFTSGILQSLLEPHIKYPN